MPHNGERHHVKRQVLTKADSHDLGINLIGVRLRTGDQAIECYEGITTGGLGERSTFLLDLVCVQASGPSTDLSDDLHLFGDHLWAAEVGVREHSLVVEVSVFEGGLLEDLPD